MRLRNDSLNKSANRIAWALHNQFGERIEPASTPLPTQFGKRSFVSRDFEGRKDLGRG